MPNHEVAAQDAKGRWVLIDDVAGENPAAVRITAVTDMGHGMVRLACSHPTLGTWRPEYRKRHMLKVAR